MNSLGLASLVVASVLGTSPHCLGQSVSDVSGFTIDLDNGWRLYPGFVGSHLEGYLAQQITGDAAPLGYSVVWFERQADDSFSMKGYDGLKTSDAATKIEDSRNQPGLFSHCDFADGVVGVITEPSASFVEMLDGLAVTDPLQPVAAELSSEVMEAYVMSAGEGAASLSAASVSSQSGCGTIQSVLAALVPQDEGIIASNGDAFPDVSNPCVESGDALIAINCSSTSIFVPTGSWTSSNPTGTKCSYTRPTLEKITVCCWHVFGPITCTKKTGRTALQSGSCPGNPSGNCPTTPSCVP